MLSCFALWVSVYEAISNKPKLRLSSGHLFVPNGVGRLVFLDVINYGRQPTTVTSVQVTIPGSTKRLHIAPENLGATWPHCLEVGTNVRFVFQVGLDTHAERVLGGPPVELRQILDNPKTRFAIDDVWYRKPHFVGFPRIVRSQK